MPELCSAADRAGAAGRSCVREAVAAAGAVRLVYFCRSLTVGRLGDDEFAVLRVMPRAELYNDASRPDSYRIVTG